MLTAGTGMLGMDVKGLLSRCGHCPMQRVRQVSLRREVHYVAAGYCSKTRAELPGHCDKIIGDTLVLNWSKAAGIRAC